MDISLVSDLHLDFRDVELHGGEVLVMSGDIFEASIFKTSHKSSNIRDRYMRFIDEELSKYDEVIYVLGNHEYYNSSYFNVVPLLRSNLPSHVHLLDNEVVKIGDVNFFGTTLWTNVNKGDPVSMEIIKNGMNDYRAITMGRGFQQVNASGQKYYTSKFTPTISKQFHHESLEILRKHLKSNHDEKFVVCTHHAPSFQSIDPFYSEHYHMNGAYCSALDGFILDNPNILAWTHGHIHYFSDYIIGNTRVMCNPRGYAGYEAIAKTFDSSFSFEV